MPSVTGGTTKKAKAMNKKNLQHFEKRLLEERRRVLKELGHYDETFGSTPQSADGDLSSYSFHMADQGTDAMEREKAFLFASQEGRFLWHIDEALRRLYALPTRSASATTARRRSPTSVSMRCRMRGIASSASSARKMPKSSSPNAAVFWPVVAVIVVADS
jgi:RNA polymerase-binding transcription factor DksA